MKILLGHKDADASNGRKWQLKFYTYSFYACDEWLPEDAEYEARYCEEYFDSRKEYKKHLATHKKELL